MFDGTPFKNLIWRGLGVRRGNSAARTVGRKPGEGDVT